jgi:hypothetical protein
MNPKENIDNLISKHQDWRGSTLSKLRKAILEVNPKIIEEWKWRGAPVWSLDGVICVGNIFKDKVKLVFMNGASLIDPSGLFNNGLEGNKWRAIDFDRNYNINEVAFKNLVKEAIKFNQSKKK